MDASFQMKARTIERKFQRELIKRGYFFTVKGRINHLVSYGKTHLTIKTEKGTKPISISRKAIRKAVSFFTFKRTMIRKDTEQFSRYSSAIFAILTEIFKKVTKLQILKNGLYRLNKIGVLFLPSGLERSPSILKMVKELNGKFVLFSYISILESPSCLSLLDELDLYCIVDSSAYGFFTKKQKEQKGSIQQQKLFQEELLGEMTLEGYANFINSHKQNRRILGFLPLDCIGDPKATKSNYRKLKNLTDAHIIPVWQFTDSIEELERLVKEEHELISIGGMVPWLNSRKDFIREKLDQVFHRFPTQRFHALGVACELLLEYNFASSDSTAYLNARKYAKGDGRRIYLPNGKRVKAPVTMSTRDIIKQNLEFLLSLENHIPDNQLSWNLIQEAI